MALLAPQQVGITGLKPTMQAAAGGGDTIRPDDRARLHVKNGDAASKTVTIVVPGTTFGQANPDVAAVIPAGEEWDFAGFGDPRLIDPTTGLVSVTYSAVTSVTVALTRN